MKEDKIRKAFEAYYGTNRTWYNISFKDFYSAYENGYKSRDKEIEEFKKQIELMHNTTTVTKDREKDEYWGYWETCNSCGSSMISESNYCPNCGKRIKRGAE